MNTLSSERKVSETPPAGLVPTYEVFLETYPDQRAEYVDGRILTKMTTTRTHDELAGFLYSLLKFYSQIHGIGKVFGDSFQMKLEIDGTIRGREPDVMFVAKENLEMITERFLDGPADVAVEIVSADSEERDRVEKFREYEAAGVREYWLIDPRKSSAEFFKLGAQGRFELMSIEEGGVFRSDAVKGFWLKTEWLLHEGPPELIDAFVALGLIDR